MKGDTPQATIRLFTRCPRCGQEFAYRPQYPLDQPQRTYVACSGDMCRHGFYVKYEPPGQDADGGPQ